MELVDVLKQSIAGNEDRLLVPAFQKDLANELNKYRTFKNMKDCTRLQEALKKQKFLEYMIEAKNTDNVSQRSTYIEKAKNELPIQEQENTLEDFIYALNIDAEDDVSKPEVTSKPEVAPEPEVTSDSKVTPESKKVTGIYIEDDTWECICGNQNNGNFCTCCGEEKNIAVKLINNKWKCPCGQDNYGNYCTQCGKHK